MPELRLLPLLGALLASGCAVDAGPVADGWTGTMDTLPSGQILVQNDANPVWEEGREWQVVEELRIGSVAGDGPDVFGRVEAFEVDGEGRIWILDRHARQVLVFDSSGSHLRTIGRRGGGPGEFEHPVDIDLAPDGHMWVVDVVNVRISAFDTAGRYVDSRQIPTRFRMTPWLEGGFDDRGRFYAPVGAAPSESEQVAFTLVRHDSALVPSDTLEPPRDPITRQVVNDRGVVMRIPFQGGLGWRLSRDGTIWAMVTDEYRLFELSWTGDTLRTIRRASTPSPVTEADLEQLRRTWAREIERSGLPSWWSRLPTTKPPVTGMFLQDEERGTWVERQPEPVTDSLRVFDVFDRQGRYLGPVVVPFALRSFPRSIIRDGFLYGVTFDELDVPYVVKARIIKTHPTGP